MLVLRQQELPVTSQPGSPSGSPGAASATGLRASSASRTRTVTDILWEFIPELLFKDASSLVFSMEGFYLVFEKEDSKSEKSLHTQESGSEFRPPTDPAWPQPEGSRAHTGNTDRTYIPYICTLVITL